MQIRQTKVDVSFERRILIGMIISDHYLSGVSQMYRPEFWNGSGSGIVAKWCIKYWGQYEKAPGRHIQDIFEEEEREGRLQEADLKYIELLLSGLSEQFEEEVEKFNSEYLLDQTEKWFRKKSLELLTKEIQSRIAQEDINSAEEKLLKYNVVRKSGMGWVDPFSSDAVQKVCTINEEKPLFKLKGVLGDMFEYQLMRDSLIAFLAPEKRGKSYFLLEIAMMAYRGRCNVALFEAGDMTERQVLKRIHSYVCESPLGKKQKRISMPKFVEGNTKKYKIDTDEFITDSIDMIEVKNRVEKWKKRGGKKEIRMSFHENSSLTVRDIRRILDEWEKGKAEDGSDVFIPDVVIVDYADILAPEDPRKEFRHQQNDTWKALRALSQNRHCCVITATQAAASSYKKNTIELDDFSEDKRKYGHVTAFYSLNQSKEERDVGCLRIGEMIIREGGMKRREVSVLQCLDLGRPYVDSRWSYEVEVPKGLNQNKD